MNAAAPAANGADDLAGRVRGASSRDTPAALLEQLARDPSETVRAAVALNADASGACHLALAHDGDARVRDLLARKLGRASAGLPKDVHARMADAAWQALSILVADEAVRVRAALAGAVADMPDAPRDLILTLAHDTVIAVSGPVIRLSPLLTTDDLLSLIAAPPCPAAVEAVARRAEVCEAISDAIVRVAGVNAVTALLSNPGAMIRETTLDALIARAAEQAGWHAPLVRRPALPARAALALSVFVATSFVKELAARADLPAATVQLLRERLVERLSQERKAQEAAGGAPDQLVWRTAKPGQPGTRSDQPAMHAKGPVSDDTVLAAIRRGDVTSAGVLLAMGADVPYAVVERAARLRSGKAIVALTWKAGLSTRLAGPLQVAVGNVAPDDVLRASAEGAFPLTLDEMRWQLEFLAGRGAQA